MEFFRFKNDIPFMRHALVFNVISMITFLAAIFFLSTRGLNFGVDFRGGTVIEVQYAHAADFDRVRTAIDTLKLGEYSVQRFGNAETALVRLPLKEGVSSAKLSDQVMGVLKADDASASQKRVEFVGPQVGKELYENGALALLLVAIGIVAYLAMRFEWRFALAAVIADRIRENVRKMRKATVTHVIDNAITRTMSRTIITHGSTQIMVTSMLIFGGETLHYFALALSIGILFGIYSSVLVLAP